MTDPSGPVFKSAQALADALGINRSYLNRCAKAVNGGKLPPWWPKKGQPWPGYRVCAFCEAHSMWPKDWRQRLGVHQDQQGSAPPPMSALDRQRAIAANSAELDYAERIGRLIDKDVVLAFVRELAGLDADQWSRVMLIPQQAPLLTATQREWMAGELMGIREQRDQAVAKLLARLQAYEKR